MKTKIVQRVPRINLSYFKFQIFDFFCYTNQSRKNALVARLVLLFALVDLEMELVPIGYYIDANV